MNIAIVNSRFGFWGGVEKYIYLLGRLMRQWDYQICGIFEQCDKEDAKFGEIFTDWVQYNTQSKAELEEQLGKIDLVLIHKVDNIDLLRLLKDNFPTILFVHDHDYYCVRKHKYFPVTRVNCSRRFNLFSCSLCSGMLEKTESGIRPVNIMKRVRMLNLLKQTDKQIVLSDYMRKNLTDNGFQRCRISKLHPFIEQQQPTEYKKHTPAELLFVGQIIRGKGVDLLIEASRLLKNPYRLSILGKGNDFEFVQDLIKNYNLEEKIDLVGFSLEVNRYYREADLLVVPCRWQEPFGLIGIEAFNWCKPVIAFNTGGISEWLKPGENGVLVHEKDVKAFARGIDYLISNPRVAASMGKNGYELLNREYSEKHFTMQFKKILEEFGV